MVELLGELVVGGCAVRASVSFTFVKTSSLETHLYAI